MLRQYWLVVVARYVFGAYEGCCQTFLKEKVVVCFEEKKDEVYHD
jgi:hypothetical protein